MRKELLRRELGRMMRALQDSRDKSAETPALNFPEAKILERSWCATGQAHEQAKNFFFSNKKIVLANKFIQVTASAKTWASCRKTPFAY